VIQRNLFFPTDCKAFRVACVQRTPSLSNLIKFLIPFGRRIPSAPNSE
jgi:hypothetical protein